MDSVRTQTTGAILEDTLDRPKANAIDLVTSWIMGEVFQRFRDDPDLRVAIVTGAGDRFFCPGSNLHRARARAALLASSPPIVYAAIKEIPREAEEARFQDIMNRVTGRQQEMVDVL